MCGRYLIESDNERMQAIIERMQRDSPGVAAQLGEVFPTQMAPVIVAQNGDCTVRAMRWGFPRGGGHGVVINSRSEKADYTPMFQRAVRERRCLVPMTAFYEWRRTPSGGKTKDKFAFVSKGGQERGVMYLAGVYGEFLGGFAGGGFDGFAILTREADAQMSPYHARMPVILDNEQARKLWLLAPPQMPYAELRRQFETPKLYVRPVANG